MNKERVLAFAKYLDTRVRRKDFNLSDPNQCVSAHLLAFCDLQGWQVLPYGGGLRCLRYGLSLTGCKAADIYSPRDHICKPLAWDKVTPKVAAQMLCSFVRTGTVSYKRAFATLKARRTRRKAEA